MMDIKTIIVDKKKDNFVAFYRFMDAPKISIGDSCRFPAYKNIKVRFMSRSIEVRRDAWET